MDRRHIDFSVKGYLDRLMSVRELLDLDAIERGIGMVKEAWLDGRQVVVCGNGGSALAASHYITDWNKSVYMSSGRPFKGVCLNDNIGLLTAYANDVSYEDVFVEQLKHRMDAKDLVIVVTGSGNSPNVVKVVKHAAENGASTLAICGYDGGIVKKIAQHSVWVPSFDMQICEDFHLIFGHLVMKALCEGRIFV